MAIAKMLFRTSCALDVAKCSKVLNCRQNHCEMTMTQQIHNCVPLRLIRRGSRWHVSEFVVLAPSPCRTKTALTCGWLRCLNTRRSPYMSQCVVFVLAFQSYLASTESPACTCRDTAPNRGFELDIHMNPLTCTHTRFCIADQAYTTGLPSPIALQKSSSLN